MIEIRHEAIVGTADSREAYDRIYEQAPIEHMRSLYLWLADVANPRPGELFLDISCGTGALPAEAARRQALAHGLDFALPAVRRARDRAQVRAVVGDAEHLPYADASFDVVCNIGSLEHYQDMPGALAEMRRVLRPTGRAIVLLPNAFALVQVLRVWRTGTVDDDGQPLQRVATLDHWARLLTSAGYAIRRVRPYDRELPRTWPDLRWYLHRPTKLARALLAPLLPLTWAACFVFECTLADARPAGMLASEPAARQPG